MMMLKDGKEYLVKVFPNIHQNYVCAHFIEIPKQFIKKREEVSTPEESIDEIFTESPEIERKDNKRIFSQTESSSKKLKISLKN